MEASLTDFGPYPLAGGKDLSAHGRSASNESPPLTVDRVPELVHEICAERGVAGYTQRARAERLVVSEAECLEVDSC
jgi:hypothetical protein